MSGCKGTGKDRGVVETTSRSLHQVFLHTHPNNHNLTDLLMVPTVLTATPRQQKFDATPQ